MGWFEAAPLPPQPIAANRLAAETMSMRMTGRRLRGTRKRVNAVSSPRGRTASENRGARVSGDAVVMLVCSVTVVIAGLRPTGVTGLGEAVQVELAGAPMQVTAVGAVNPPLGVMEKVVVAGLPWVTVVVVAESERVKSGGTGIVTIWGAEVEEVKPPTAPG